MIRNIFISIICIIFSTASFSGTIGYTNNWKKGISLSVGPVWSNPGTKQIINFTSTFSQTYVPKSNTATFGSGELFLNLQRYLGKKIDGQFGITLAATTGIPLKGEIWQDNDPSFNNFDYSYKIEHWHVGFRTKLLSEMGFILTPYISASLNAGFNHAYHYKSVPRIVEVSSEPPFKSYTNSAFTYTIDIGLNKKFNPNWSMGIGYEFADWGKTYLNKASDQISGLGLNLNHVYTNSLQINLNYIA